MLGWLITHAEAKQIVWFYGHGRATLGELARIYRVPAWVIRMWHEAAR